MRVVRTCEDAGLWCSAYRSAGLSLGLVPTMGALHEGHLALVRRAVAECDRVAVSLFVNPTQFGPNEDLTEYPRTLEADLEACRSAGVALAFVAQDADMYPSGFQTWVQVTELTQPLCGRSRSVHFRGVATVVTQLLQVVAPHRAYFGQKDYQQAQVITRLVADLHFPTVVSVVPTVREADGLALSSRNRNLSPSARRDAVALDRALARAEKEIQGGERRASRVQRVLHEFLASTVGIEVDYAEVLVADSLTPPAGDALRPGDRIVLAVAASFGATRLIDNRLVEVGPLPQRSVPHEG